MELRNMMEADAEPEQIVDAVAVRKHVRRVAVATVNPSSPFFCLELKVK